MKARPVLPIFKLPMNLDNSSKVMSTPTTPSNSEKACVPKIGLEAVMPSWPEAKCLPVEENR